MGIMIVVCTETLYVNLSRFCSGGSDDGDGAGDGDDDGAGNADDELDDDGDKYDF